MNYQSIWKGDEYAWAASRPKGVFPRNGRRCKVLDKRKVTYPGNERQSAEVFIEYLARDGVPIQRWVPAREIVDFWDNYESELEHVLEESRLRRERADEERRQRMQAREDEKRRQEEEAERRYTDFAERTGIPRDAISLLSDISVTITIPALERRLGIDW